MLIVFTCLFYNCYHFTFLHMRIVSLFTLLSFRFFLCHRFTFHIVIVSLFCMRYRFNFHIVIVSLLTLLSFHFSHCYRFTFLQALSLLMPHFLEIVLHFHSIISFRRRFVCYQGSYVAPSANSWIFCPMLTVVAYHFSIPLFLSLSFSSVKNM